MKFNGRRMPRWCKGGCGLDLNSEGFDPETSEGPNGMCVSCAARVEDEEERIRELERNEERRAS